MLGLDHDASGRHESVPRLLVPVVHRVGGRVDDFEIAAYGEPVHGHDGELGETDAERLSELLESLAKLYAHHIDVEDHMVFPAAARMLPPEQVIAIGKEMASRRRTGLSACSGTAHDAIQRS